jgi:hypothetical protein
MNYSRAVAAATDRGFIPPARLTFGFARTEYAAGVAVLVSSTEIKYKGVWHKRLYTREFF